MAWLVRQVLGDNDKDIVEWSVVAELEMVELELAELALAVECKLFEDVLVVLEALAHKLDMTGKLQVVELLQL